MPLTWLRKRVTSVMPTFGGGLVRLLLGERSDGGVFYIEIPIGRDSNNLQVYMTQYANAEFHLDRFLDAPLFPPSIGQFDINPKVWL